MNPNNHTTVDEAAEIMGDNFHGLDALERHFGARISARAKKRYLRVPFSSEILRDCAKTHILVACGRLSLMDLWRIQSQHFYVPTELPWYQNEDFANIKTYTEWQLVCRSLVPYSTSDIWRDQIELLGRDDEVPSASSLAQVMLLHKQETGERLVQQIRVRTSDFVSSGGRVCLGYIDEAINVHCFWDTYRDPFLALISSRRAA